MFNQLTNSVLKYKKMRDNYNNKKEKTIGKK